MNWKTLYSGFLKISLLAAGLFIVLAAAAHAAEIELSDANITRAVEVDIRDHELISDHLIDVDTENGIVSLTGSVDHILARERAEEIAGSIRGVRSVVNRLEVRPVAREDSEISGAIKAALTAEATVDASDITFDVKVGIVTVSGEVSSYPEKLAALDVAKSISGVRKVNNQIKTVNVGERRDEDVAADIRRRLKVDALILHDRITVTVNEGKVTLSGVVGSPQERTRAFNKSWILGVATVDDSGLKVNPEINDPYRRDRKVRLLTDDEVQRAVEDSLRQDPRLVALHVDAKVNAGSVLLTGSVDRLKAKNAATEDALNTIGVRSVDNRIKVRPQNPPTDFTIARNLKDALMAHPVLEKYELDVEVRNNEVTLYGEVDNLLERLQAEEVAADLIGVVRVNNLINVVPEWSWISDAVLKKDIREKYFWNVHVDGSDISIEVDDGEVTLSGEVGTWSEFRQAEEEAYEAGARNVKNMLSVREAPDQSPADLYAGYY